MAESEKSAVDRRKLLRRGGIVAAGVAGAGVAGAVAATPAQAAPGDPVLQGQANNAGTASTQIQSNGAVAPTLALSNPYEEGTPSGGVAAGPALRLVPHGDWLKDESPAGSISADALGLPWVSVDDGFGTFSYAAHTSFNSNTIVPVTPTRVVDTRNAAGRQYITNAGGNLDSAGRLLSTKTININLSEFAYFADAVLLNATVAGPLSYGYLTVWAYGTQQPAASSLNYATGQNLSNFVFSAAGWQDDNLTTLLSVYAHRTTHVILDVVGFVVSLGAVNPGITAAGQASGPGVKASSAAAERARTLRTSKPSWKK